MVRLALGTVQWGMPYGINNQTGQPDRDTVAEILEIARRCGVEWLDTAPAYGDSESVIGATTDHQWRVATKVTPDAATGDDLDRSLRRSWSRLGRPPDAVLVHRVGQLAGPVWERLQQRRELGDVSAIGASAETGDAAWSILESNGVEVAQVPVNLFDRDLVYGGFFDVAAERGITVFARSSYLQGAALMDPDEVPAHLAELVDPLVAVRHWADAHDMSMPAVLVGYVAAATGGIPVVGVETTSQVRDAAAAAETRLSSHQLETLESIVPVLPKRVVTPALWPG